MPLFDVRLLDVPLIAGQARMRERLGAMRQSLLPALLAAHAAGREIAVGWVRPYGSAQLQVRLTGWPLCDGRVSFPAGAHGEPTRLGGTGLGAWISCAVRHDVLTMPTEPAEASEIGGVLEDLVDAVAGVPFCWLVRAVPVRRPEIRDILQDLDLELAYSHGRETLSGEHAVAAERQRALYRELAQQAGGLWRVRVDVGAEDAESAAMLAGVLSATADLHGTGYVLEPGASDAESGLTGLASGALLSAIARPPVREIAGIRVVEQAGSTRRRRAQAILNWGT